MEMLYCEDTGLPYFPRLNPDAKRRGESLPEPLRKLLAEHIVEYGAEGFAEAYGVSVRTVERAAAGMRVGQSRLQKVSRPLVVSY